MVHLVHRFMVLHVFRNLNVGAFLHFPDAFSSWTCSISQELSGDFLELALVMLREPLAFDVDLLNISLKASALYQPTYWIEMIHFHFRMNVAGRY